jgi:hypothetical protein
MIKFKKTKRLAKKSKVENRILMDIIVDAYDEQKRAMGWYYYLEEKLNFPFNAICIQEIEISPLFLKEKIKVIGMASERYCNHDMLVKISWHNRTISVPLSQLKGIKVDFSTQQAISDWCYWLNQGYEF